MTSFVVLMTVVGALIAPATAGAKAPRQEFESLAQAVEAGVVERALAERLRKGKPVVAHAVFQADEAVKAYADGNPDSVKRATELFAQKRFQISQELDLPIERSYELLPVLLTPLSREDQALRLINHDLVVALWLNGEMELWLSRSLPRIGQPLLAAGGLTGAGAAVAVLDTGADTTLPELTNSVPVSVEAAPNDGSTDDNGHGSRVSVTVATVAPGLKIIPIDIMDGTRIRESDVLIGLNWVLANRHNYNIRAVNISFGRDEYHNGDCGGGRTPYNGAFGMMRQSGTLPIVASGNHARRGGAFRSGIALPACVPGAVSVGASYTSASGTAEVWPDCTDAAPVAADTPACASAGGPALDLFAPGSNIRVASGTSNGTSIAAPHVSAVAAVLATISPYATTQTLETQLKSSSVQIFDPRSGTTHPRLNIPDVIRAAAPVPNDNRATPALLTKWSGRTEQRTWAATKEPGELNHGGNSGGSSIWYRWTPAQTGTVDLTTEGSSFDTVLAAYLIGSNGSSTLLAENDNAGPSQTSFITIPVTAGQTIDIAIDGVRQPGMVFAASGLAKLTWNLPNDDLADALLIARAPGVANQGSNIAATKQYGEPAHCGDTFSTASVWYRWAPPTPWNAHLRASGSQLLCVTVYKAPATLANPAFDQLTLVTAYTDDQGSPIEFDFIGVPWENYWIAVDGVSIEQNCHPVTGQCWYTTPTGVFNLWLE
jgi:hypothetical protein